MKKNDTLKQATPENLANLINITCETLLKQNEAFQENMLSKENKSMIYERLKENEERITKVEDLIKGTEFSKGIFDRIEETNKKIIQLNNEVNHKISHMNTTLLGIADTLKEEKIRKKTLASMLKIVFSLMGFVGASNVVLLLKMLVK